MTAQALDGVKVIEFGGYAAGPHIGKMLANYGATVIHVESLSRPDGFRLQYPPYKDGQPGINAGGCFAYFNDSKLGVTLELKNPHGLHLARQLVAWSDIVIENMRPGVLDRIGLGYEALRQDHPELIMLSTCNMGQTGPRADTPGFGSQLTALAGMCGLTGDPAGPPMLLYGPYIDFIASTLGAAAVLAALEKRRALVWVATWTFRSTNAGPSSWPGRCWRITPAALSPNAPETTTTRRRRTAHGLAAKEGGWPCLAGLRRNSSGSAG